MSKTEFKANTVAFVRATLTEVSGKAPSAKAVKAAAEKIVEALEPTMQYARPAKSERGKVVV